MAIGVRVGHAHATMSESQIVKFTVCAHLDDGEVIELSKAEVQQRTSGGCIWSMNSATAAKSCGDLTSSEHGMLFNLLTMTCAVRVRMFDAPKAFVDALAGQYCLDDKRNE